MGVFGKILLGFFVGLLCGLVPLIYGFLTNKRIFGIVGIAVTAVSGIVFSILDKSPFTAMVIAALFLLFNFADNKRHSKHKDDTDNDII